MKPSENHFLKIDLDQVIHLCGCCQHASNYEVYIYMSEVEALKAAAQEILDANNGIKIQIETALKVTSFFDKVLLEKVYCRNQKCWTHIGEICSIWQPRIQNHD